MTTDIPEINVAKGLIRNKSLVPPIDIEALIKEFAFYKKIDFPDEFDVDGLCIDLKVAGKTRVYVNSRGRGRNRLRFTLAHELGHILIPWHIGTIIDRIDLFSDDDLSIHWQMEGEANRFAAEILMPSTWIKERFSSNLSPVTAIDQIKSSCGVSTQAALIQINNTLPPGYVYAIVEQGIIIKSNKSPGTMASRLHEGSQFNPSTTLRWAKQNWQATYYQATLHWWYCETGAVPEVNASCDWRWLLERIISDLVPDAERARHHKQSINGTISSANSAIINGRAKQSHFEICMQKFLSRAEYDDFTAAFIRHEQFAEFLTSRVKSFER